MDFAVQAALLGAVMGSAILAVATLYGWTLPAAPKSYGWWAVAFLLDALGKAVLLGHSNLVETADMLHGLAAALILCGAAVMGGRRPGAGSVALGVAAAFLWTLLVQVPRRTFDLPGLPFLGLAGLPLLAAAWSFIRHDDGGRIHGHRFAAATFATAGLYQLAAPAMLSSPAAANWSLLFSQLSSMMMAVAVLLVVLRRQQHRADSASERANLLESRLVDALGNVADGVALFDADNRLVTCNQRYCRFLAPVGHLVRPGMSFQNILDISLDNDLVPAASGRRQDWLAEVLAEQNAAVSSRREQQYHDGRWAEVSVVRTTDGGHLRILRDITESKQAEVALSEGLAWLRGIMDAVVDGIVTIDGSGHVLSINPAAERIFGYAAGEVVGTNVKILMPEPYHSEHDAYLGRYRDTGVRRIIGSGRQVAGRRKDGSDFPLELSVTEMHQGETTTFIGVLRDITDRKRVEDALMDSERRFRAQAFQLQAIIDNMAQGIVVFDGAEALVARNEVAEDLLELPAGAAGATTLSALLGLMAEAEGKAAAELMADRLASIRGHAAMAFEHSRPNGIVLEVRSTAMPGGGFILTFTDITDRKRVERALREAKEAAERGNRAKATFLANISHELRTPLNAIIGFSELIKHEIFGPMEPPNYRHYVDDIHESGMHLLELINDILDMSKAEAGMTDLVDTPVDLATVVHGSMRMMAKRAESAHIHLAANLPADLPRLKADERRIRQIVLNLLSNAVKFTEDGGTVTVTARVTETGLELRVTDTGIGMTPEELVRVMEPFVQADSRLSRKYEGTGLGLPLTKALVTAHGGTFVLSSEPEAGTAATVTFPASRMLAATDAAVV